jgi:RNA ligase
LLGDVLDLENLGRMLAERYINLRKHPQVDAWILDYSQHAQYDRVWNNETLNCRGLIVVGHPTSGIATIAARPFAKFFNASEHRLSPLLFDLPIGSPFEVFDKADGSLGVLHNVTGTPAISTRGSFESDQAKWATQLWRERYADYPLPEGATMLFEIIAPWNRIVCSYGDMEDLVLLAVLDRRTGADLSLPADWPGPVIRRHDGVSSLDELEALAETDTTPDFEGYVIRFVPNDPNTPSLRAKVKLAEYIRLHRIVTGVNAKRIWEHLSSDGNIDEILDRVPDEFYRWVNSVVDRLTTDYSEIEAKCQAVVDALPSGITRREQAERILASGVPSDVCFKMLDNQDIAKPIWRILEPEFEPPFKTDLDA